jgi:hypothetical protein
MAVVSQYGKENYIANGMGIPAHDYVFNVYDGNNNLINIEYRIGGATGQVVAVVAMTYDVSNNLETVTRVQ